MAKSEHDKVEKDWAAVSGAEEKEAAPEPMETDETQETNASIDEIESLDRAELIKQLAEAKQAAADNLNKLLLSQAERKNEHDRAVREMKKVRQYAIVDFARELLHVVDNLERGMEASNPENEDIKHLLEGVALTLKMFYDILAKVGIQTINPMGEIFNPELHEAMSVQVNDEVPAETILVVLQKGYQMHDRVLRPARVIISRKSSS